MLLLVVYIVVFVVVGVNVVEAVVQVVVCSWRWLQYCVVVDFVDVVVVEVEKVAIRWKDGVIRE